MYYYWFVYTFDVYPHCDIKTCYLKIVKQFMKDGKVYFNQLKIQVRLFKKDKGFLASSLSTYELSLSLLHCLIILLKKI